MSIGRSIVRVDAWNKVQGKAKYVDDISFPGMVYVVTVRSKVAHGIIEELPNTSGPYSVIGVFTYRDIPGKNVVPLVFSDWPFLAENRVRFKGEPVALVCGERFSETLAAAKYIESKIKYRELEGSFSIEDSLKGVITIFGNDNIFKSYVIKKGDIEKGLREADIVEEEIFYTGHQEHAYLEPQGIIALPDTDGGITVYGSMQCPFYVRDAVCAILGLPKSKVRIIQTEVGGGFGGKEDVPSLVAGHAALVAWKMGRPAKLIYDREEDILTMSKRHPAKITVKYGITRSGKIVACKVNYILDGGAYATLSPIVLWRGTVHASGPYEIENVLIESKAVATNKVPCGAFRGFGQPQVSFAQESLLNHIARKYNMDPVEIRYKNILDIGKITATGEKIEESCGLREALNKVVSESNWYRLKERKGFGVSVAYYGVNLGAGGKHIDRAGATLQIEKDGSIIVGVGNTEIGQGARTEIAQIVAEAFGIEVERIQVLPVDTSFVPDSGPTVASRTTISSGNAILDGANILLERLKGVVELSSGEKVKEFVKGVFVTESKKYNIKEVIEIAHQYKVNLSSRGWWNTPETSFDPETGQGKPYIVYSYSATITKAKVDQLRLKVIIDNIWSVIDVGKAINPLQVKGQIEGGIVMAIGYSLMEYVAWDKGEILNPSLSGYIIPTVKDLPKIDAYWVESPYSKGPFGAKGFGEVPMIGTPASIAGAVSSYINKDITCLPITPEYLYQLIYKGEENNGS